MTRYLSDILQCNGRRLLLYHNHVGMLQVISIFRNIVLNSGRFAHGKKEMRSCHVGKKGADSRIPLPCTKP